MSDATCSVEGCEKLKRCRGMCSMHYQRWRTRGDAGGAQEERRANGARVGRRVIPDECSVDGCDQPSRKRGWCASHYSQWRQTGEVKPFRRKWSEPGQVCKTCGEKPAGESMRSRQFCSTACQQMWYRRGAYALPKCWRCGVEIPQSESRYRMRVDRVLCQGCRTRSRTEASAWELARRDGPYCMICGCDVDMTARRPDPMRPSVDHIIPRSWGGGDGAEQTQLAHLACNHRKSNSYAGGLDFHLRRAPRSGERTVV